MIDSGSLNGLVAPGKIRVELIKGASKLSSKAKQILCSGTLRPNVRFFGESINFGTVRVAFKMKVYEPGVNAFKRRKIGFVTIAYLLSSDRSLPTNVIL